MPGECSIIVSQAQGFGVTSVAPLSRKERTHGRISGAHLGAHRRLERQSESKWWVILRGVVAMLFGLVILAWPAITLRALLVVFGIFAIAAGVFAILSGLRARREGAIAGCYLAEGVVAALAGIVALGWPGVTAICPALHPRGLGYRHGGDRNGGSLPNAPGSDAGVAPAGQWGHLGRVWHPVARVAVSGRAGTGLVDWHLRDCLWDRPSGPGIHRRACEESRCHLTR